jgi:branched-chain amino acid aminotransferase
MNYTCFNGNILPSDEPVLNAANRAYRYGDGLFETMKLFRGNILFEHLHFDRLFSGLSLLKMTMPGMETAVRLKEELMALCIKNECGDLARVRLSVSRGNGGLYDTASIPDYLIECWPLDISANQLNESGLVTAIFPDSRKSLDKFSNVKSASALPYVMAALFARENKLDDCFVMNTDGNIADSTIANLFLVKEGRISTPALAEGCVAGVMRDYLIAALGKEGQLVKETRVRPEDLLNADELFLTNAINGIRWVKQFGEKSYSNEQTVKIYDRLIRTFFT